MGCTLTILSKFCCFWSPGPFLDPFLATGTHLFLGARAPRSFLGDWYTTFFGCTGSKILSWRPVHTFFGVPGLQDPFLATGTHLFWGSRAPKTFLGDRYTPFSGFPGSKILFLATGTHLFWGARAPRSFLGDWYTPFFGCTGSKILFWRPLHLLFGVSRLQDPFLATATPLFQSYRAQRTKLKKRAPPRHPLN
jgi:hypothetical protein